MKKKGLPGKNSVDLKREEGGVFVPLGAIKGRKEKERTFTLRVRVGED